MIKSTQWALITVIAFYSINATAMNPGLEILPDTEAIMVVMKIPQELKPEKLEVMYRSTICKRVSPNSSGILRETNGFNSMDVVFVPYQTEGSYIAKAPIDGGGGCHWKLSNIAFSVAYLDTAQFGENISYQGGAGISVNFDGQNPRRSSGGALKVEGDVHVIQDYYPWVDENFLGGYWRTVRLVADRNLYKTYNAFHARNVYFEPVLHSAFVVRSKSPLVKAEGNRTIFTYPDGTSRPEATGGPSFRKLQEIRLASEGG